MLAPLLFAIYIDDLILKLRQSGFELHCGFTVCSLCSVCRRYCPSLYSVAVLVCRNSLIFAMTNDYSGILILRRLS